MHIKKSPRPVNKQPAQAVHTCFLDFWIHAKLASFFEVAPNVQIAFTSMHCTVGKAVVAVYLRRLSF